MVNKWVTRRIGEIGRVVTGKTPPTKDKGNFGGPYPFITIPDLDGRAVIDQTARTLSAKGASVVKSSLLPPGAVLMSCIATIGKCGITTEPSFTNQQINSVIVDDKTDSRFLYYVFTQLGHELEVAGGGGSIYTNVSKTRFSNIEITLPSDISEQRAIAHILGTLDDKIELNRRMNETLEEMARAIFKSWFVDFDPVRAKMDGRWRRGESLPGMPAEMYDLFPERLVDSELGEIPEGWGVSEIGREVEVVGGGTPSTKDMSFWDGGNIHWATPKDLSRLQSLILIETERKITSVGLKKISSGLLPVGTVLMSSRAPVGYLAIAQVPLAVNQGFIAMKCDERISREYTLFWCSENMNIIKAHASGTTFQEISKRNFRLLKVLVPTTGVLRVFDNMVNSLFERITLNLHESRTLAGLRDTLLPKLISGELRVRKEDIENISSEDMV